MQYMTSRKKLSVLIIFACTAVLTSALIYLTPLKHLSVLPPTMDEIDPKAIYADMQKTPNDYVFIDVRDANIYDAAHAIGAKNVPIADLVTEHYLLPRSGKQIVLICTTGELATVAYGYLENLGFQNLLHITGGLSKWVLEGLPVKGSKVINDIDTAPMVPDGASG
jgi:hydroxyacylglutathione hydrolase